MQGSAVFTSLFKEKAWRSLFSLELCHWHSDERYMCIALTSQQPQQFSIHCCTDRLYRKIERSLMNPSAPFMLLAWPPPPKPVFA